MANPSILDSLKMSSVFSSETPVVNPKSNKSEYWLNIGYMADDGQHFVSLTKGGVPLDNMEPEQVSNPDSEYGQLLLAQNYLLECLKRAAAELMPGETKILDGLTVQLRRKKDTVTSMPNANTNKFIKAMGF